MRAVIGRLFLILAFVSSPFLCFAASVSGVVVDRAAKTALPYANVELLLPSDSSSVSAIMTGEDGAFSFDDVAKGDYLLRATYMGYLDRYRKVKVEADSSSVDLGKVPLKVDEQLIEEVSVLANVTPLLVKEDTLIYNASSFRVADGAILEDLVKKLPGAELTNDGKLVVNGKEVKKILVDGKEFFSDDPKVSLKNLPANMVKDVKAYEKKSESAQLTGVEDDEDEMVLDLTVKKGMKDGWIGNVFGGLGSDLRVDDPDLRYELGGNVSKFTDNSNFSLVASSNNTNKNGYDNNSDRASSQDNGINTATTIGATFAKEKNEHYDYGGNVQYRHVKNDVEKSTYRETFRRSGTTYADENDLSLKHTDNLSSSFRFKWTPDSMTNIVFRPNVSYSHNWGKSESFSSNYNNAHKLNYSKESSRRNSGDNLNLNGSLRFVRKLNDKGRNLGLNLSSGYNYVPSDQSSMTRTDFRFYDDEADMDASVDSSLLTDRWTDKRKNGFNYSAEASYTEPLFPKHYLTFKYRFQHRGSDSRSYVYDANELSTMLDSLSSSVKNNYNTHRAEVGFQGRSTKMNYNVGFALQPQISSTENLLGANKGKDTRQTVLNFSPSLRYMYRFSKQKNLMLRYNGQSSAPNVEDLQRVIDESDPLNLRYGNPDLKPSYTNTVTARFKNYNQEKQSSIMANVTFRNVVNAITNIILYDETTGAQEYHRANVNGNWDLNAQFSNSTPFRKHRNFLFSGNTKVGYSREVSFEDDGMRRTLGMLDLFGKYQLGYKNDRFNTYLYAMGRYQNSTTESEELGSGLSVEVNLPWRMILSSDIDYHYYSGYSDLFDKDAILWNAALTKNFLKNNAGAFKLKVFDILGQQSNLTRRISESSIVETESNTLGNYFIFQFSYKFNTLGSKTSQMEDESGSEEPRPKRSRRMAPGDAPGPGFGGGRPEGSGRGGDGPSGRW
ncbi:MAG: TonB-dependent receptor [Paludibacteraceae bacterium]|nr:TonB-dependent receptor [Paludibacteraceae bacterium]